MSYIILYYNIYEVNDLGVFFSKCSDTIILFKSPCKVANSILHNLVVKAHRVEWSTSDSIYII